MPTKKPQSQVQQTQVSSGSDTIKISAIGVPGQMQYDPLTGQTGYQGYQAALPGKQFGTYQDPFYPGSGTYGLTGPTTYTQPRYFDGDQWSPATLGVNDLIQLQNGLQAAGLYSGNYTLGVWGVNDVAAYERLLSMANAAGLDDKATLQRTIDGAKQSKGASRNPLVVKLANEDDLRAILQSGSQSVYGKFLGEDDVQKFIDGYHAQQAGAQTASYSASGYNPDTGQMDQSGAGGQGTTVTGPPTSGEGINLAMSKQLYQDHPVTAEMAQFVQAFDSLKGTLSQRLPGGGVG